MLLMGVVTVVLMDTLENNSKYTEGSKRATTYTRLIMILQFVSELAQENLLSRAYKMISGLNNMQVIPQTLKKKKNLN